MAKITKEDWKSSPDSDEEVKRERGEQSIPEFEHESLAVKLLFDKLNESIDLSNNQVDTIALNTAKTGISSSQASAITANTAKVGITTKQTTQLNSLVQSMIELTSAIKGTTVTTPTLTLVAGTKAGTYKLRLAVRISVNQGKTQIKYIDLPLT